MSLIAEWVLLMLWARLLLVIALGAWAHWRMRNQGRIHLDAPPSTRVSVIVPAFNESRHIAATLAALQSQDCPPWEIIVIDDGSTDDTAAIARRLLADDARAQVVRHDANRGKAAALNTGVGIACCEVVATVDADTRLDRQALGIALQMLAQGNGEGPADAVAFYIDVDVDNPTGLLQALQRQEYVGALNFERAGQDAVQAISVLPGAATLFRRQLLIDHSVSDRTLTEDADLTLELSRAGSRLVLADRAVAWTAVPETASALLAQRVRWITGHLQCCASHARSRPGDTWRFRVITWPNFLLSTAMAPIGFLALLVLLSTERSEWLGIDGWTASAVSVVLVYLQRGIAWLLRDRRRIRWWLWLLEPAVTNLVALVGFIGAVWALAGPRRHPAAR